MAIDADIAKAMASRALGDAFLNQYRATNDIYTLHEAIICLRDAAKPTLVFGIDSESFMRLAHTLCVRFDRAGDRVDLDDAILNYRLVVQWPSSGDHNCYLSLDNLVRLTLLRFERFGNLADLNEIVINSRSGLNLPQQALPSRLSFFQSLTYALQRRFEQLGDKADLDEVITKARDTLEPGSTIYLESRRGLVALSAGLFRRFELLGAEADLEEATITVRGALKLAVKDNERVAPLNLLAGILFRRFEHYGIQRDIDEAIIASREAAELLPTSHSSRCGPIIAQALNLSRRFEQFGQKRDLDEAIHILRNALSLTPAGHPNHFMVLGNLAHLLLYRFEYFGAQADLDESILANHRIVPCVPPEHIGYFLVLTDLALALKFSVEADLDEAIHNYRGALQLMAPGHPNRWEPLNHLGFALVRRFELFSRPADLDEGITSHREARELTPLGHPGSATTRVSLGLALLNRLTERKQDNTIDSDPTANLLRRRSEVIATFKESASFTTGAPPSARLRASLSWIDVATLWSDSSASEAYRTSLELLDIVLATGSSMELRHARLTTEETERTKSLAVDAASCALSSGQTKLAIELLEQGRSVLLTQAGKYRTRVDDVRKVDPGLADEFESVSLLMEHSIMSTGKQPTGDRESDDPIAKYQKLSERWTAAVAQIRSLNGFKSFLRPTPFATLRIAAEYGPVILLNISKSRSDAIVLHLHHEPFLVPLPHETSKTLSRLAGDIHPGKRIETLLRDLWLTLVQRVVHVLRNELQLERGSRIWWCPTGAASRLPLHAAGDYQNQDNILLDLYVSSYTPTLSALIRARENIPKNPAVRPEVLIVGLSSVQEQHELPSVACEVDLLKKMIPNNKTFYGPEATRQVILDHMAQYPWLHIACHGHVDQKQPFRSSFSLQDSPLTVLDITGQNLPNAELAFLSACHAAGGNIDRPDEVLHLTAGLQFAGFQSVVGTLWAMCDDDGPQVAEEFYSTLLGRGDRLAKPSAYALHRAVARLRESGVPSARWACFVHFGR